MITFENLECKKMTEFGANRAHYDILDAVL